MSSSPVKKTWYGEGLCFACTQCGNCCGGAPGYVWVNFEEISAIAKSMSLSVAEFERQHTRRIHTRRSLLELENGDCEFLIREPDGRTHCAIHEVRPLQCRTWPFWASNVATRRAWEQEARHCPGIDRGKLYSPAFIQASLRENEDADLPL